MLELARGALAAIEASRERIDDLNVYPVPDGDTGTNLALTVGAVVAALEADGSDERAALARDVSRAALMGARGNSGVILSQIVRGAAESLAASDDLAAALRSASDAAYRAVKKPVEGTMLTAIRELAEEAEAGGDLAALLARGDDCVARTRELLPALAQAGVVDAGAAGLVEIVRGLAGVLTGEPLPVPAPEELPRPSLESIHLGLSEFRYCTAFVVEGDRLDADELETELEALGDSILVVGDATALKIHVHTDDPGRALSLGVARGTIGGVEIGDMHEQTLDRERRLLTVVPGAEDEVPCALVAVAAGHGNRHLFENLGAHVVDGGRTMNPSTAELLDALEASGAREAVILPNDRNVLLTAEQAAEAASRPVSVLPTETLQAGLAAAVAFDPSSSRDRQRREDGRGRRRGRDRRGDDRLAGRGGKRHLDPEGAVARARGRAAGGRRRVVPRGRLGGGRAAARDAERDPHPPHGRGSPAARGPDRGHCRHASRARARGARRRPAQLPAPSERRVTSGSRDGLRPAHLPCARSCSHRRGQPPLP